MGSRVSDEIVSALEILRSPFRLQSHQIQGLDLKAIYQVFQWLVKMVVRSRKATAKVARQRALLNVSCQFSERNETNISNDDAMERFPERNIGRYGLQRIYKKQVNLELDHSKEAMVEATLLEFGERLDSKNRVKSNAKSQDSQRSLRDSFNLKSTEKNRVARNSIESTEIDRIDILKKGLVRAEVTDSENDFIQSNIENILGTDAQKIVRLNREFDLEGDSYSERDESHFKKVLSLKDEIQKETETIKELEQKKHSTRQLFEKLKNDHSLLQEQIADLESKLAQVDSKLLAEQQARGDIVNRLQELVKMNESLQMEEKSFRIKCKEESERLKDQILKLEAESSENSKLAEIERAFDIENSRFQTFRENLAKLNLQIAQVSRSLDGIPSRAELLQYEIRFVELTDLVTAKDQELRKYITQCNTLREIDNCLSRSISLLRSIEEAIPNAVKSTKGCQNLLASMKKIIGDVGISKEKVVRDLASERSSLEMLNQTYSSALEIERKYYKLVKEYQDECFSHAEQSQTKYENFPNAKKN